MDDDDDGSTKDKTSTNVDNNGDDDERDDTESNDENNVKKSQEEKGEEAKEKEEAEKKRIRELQEKYKDWPLKNIKEPHENDVMYGRGGGTNHHKGNKKYRKMVEDRKVEYVNCKRLDKPLVALEIIRLWRAQLPPGRFLKQNDKTGQWYDVGDKKAREKTSQALRERAPQIRKQQEEDDKGEGGATKSKNKTTRFSSDTKGVKKLANKVKKAILSRDHSLGREYLASDEAITINDFCWQDPFNRSKRDSSMASVTIPQHLPKTGPTPEYYGRVASGEYRREFSNGSLRSWDAAVSIPISTSHTTNATNRRAAYTPEVRKLESSALPEIRKLDSSASPSIRKLG